MDTKLIIIELYKLLKKSKKQDETPVAALIVHKNKIIAKACNSRNKTNKTIDHAEIIAIIKANKKLKNWRISNCTLYVTLEPCEMCKTVIKESRIDKVYYFLPRYKEKKQYNKTDFLCMNTDNNLVEKFNIEYKKIIKNFWQNKR